MVDQTNQGRVFILGAGFSKPAGFPLATELTDEVLQALREVVGDDYELFELVNHITRLHNWINQSPTTMTGLNIEELYEYISVYAERYRLEQHRITVGRNDGETPYVQSKDLTTWLSYLDDHLLDVLLQHEDNAQLCPIERFVATLTPTDTLITFNYDRIVERCLTAARKSWSFGMENPRSDTIPVLKMHGSIDWICLLRNQQPAQHGLHRLFSKTDVNLEREISKLGPTGEHEYDWELFQIQDQDRMRALIENRSIIQCDHRWGLAGLGPQKRPSLIPGLGVVWERARHALYNADQIVIVGFSFSGFDRLAQIEFARVVAGRQENGVHQPHVVVIDPALRQVAGEVPYAGRELIKRIEAVFRPTESVGMCHEEFDWQGLDT